MSPQPIVLQLTDHIRLDAGGVTEDDSGYTITPPDVPQIEQLIPQIDAMPDLHPTFRSPLLGVALCGLAIRWGSYFATLVDHAAPLHPDLPGAHGEQPEQYSFITDDEMKRLNIEISCNFARMAQLYHDRGFDAFYVFLTKAHAALPMPQKRVSMNRELAAMLMGCVDTGGSFIHQYEQGEIPGVFATLENGEIRHSMRMIEPEHANRFIANALTVHGWRNTVIEDIHAGSSSPSGLRPFQRRFTRNTYLQVMRSLSANCAAMAFLWDFLFDPNYRELDLPHYPMTASALSHSYCGMSGSAWSLTDASSVVQLDKPQ